MDYITHILIIIGIYVILAKSLNLIMGFSGLISVAHSAFYGIGAYVSALMTLKYESSFFVTLLCVIVINSLLGIILIIPSFKVEKQYFLFITFAFQVIVFNTLNNWIELTGGAMGISGIPPLVLINWKILSRYEYLLLIGVFVFIICLVCGLIVKSPFNRVLKAIREDEVLALTLGKNIIIYKMTIFAIGSSIAGIAGILYAHYISFIDPGSFTVMESIFIISIVIIGGAGSYWGPVLGAILLVLFPEILRFIGFPSSIAANLRQILYGVLLVTFIMWKPQGLIGSYKFFLRNAK